MTIGEGLVVRPADTFSVVTLGLPVAGWGRRCLCGAVLKGLQRKCSSGVRRG